MRQAGSGSIEVILLFRGPPQRVVGVVGFGRIVGAAGTQIVDSGQQIPFFFPGVPSPEGIGVIKRFQQSVDGVVAIDEGIGAVIERDRRKTSAAVIFPGRLLDNTLSIMQTVARRPPQTVAQIVERACRQPCRSFRFRFIILVVSQRPCSGIIRNLSEQVQVVVDIIE